MDVLSDDGQWSLVVIAMIGPAFSPRYARARALGPADPQDFVAVNVALEGPRTRRWCLTERSRSALWQSPQSLRIGPSVLRREGDELWIRLDERTAPWGRTVTGTIRIQGLRSPGAGTTLDRHGQHWWWPVAPLATATVTFEAPEVSFRGSAYVDAQAGGEPLEQAFRSWSWARCRGRDACWVFFDVQHREGEPRQIASVVRAGSSVPVEPPPRTVLRRSAWALPRATWSDGPARVLRTTLDAPFYTRSVVEAELAGERTLGVHETLSLDRFSRRWVQRMLPYRMRRAT